MLPSASQRQTNTEVINYKHFTGREWMDARNYDLVLDTSRYTYQQCAEMIEAIVAERMKDWEVGDEITQRQRRTWGNACKSLRDSRATAVQRTCCCSNFWQQQSDLHWGWNGKGQFITSLAALHPEINYIGIEKYSSVLIRAIEKQEEASASEFKVSSLWRRISSWYFCTRRNCSHLFKFFRPRPKNRHAKRRLTSSRFLGLYDQIFSRRRYCRI